MTRRRWIADTWNEDRTRATLAGDQAAHLARVLRAEIGQVFDVVAGGFLHRAEVASVSEKEIIFLLHEELESDAALPVHLLLAIFKFDHMEWAIEKATELGVEKVTPVIARRTEKHLAQAAVKRVERWRKIAFEAAKQSRRVSVPEVAEPVRLDAALKNNEATTKILLAETEQENSLTARLKDHGETIALAIGPEGGWSVEEMDQFSSNNWLHATLGPRILRAETAAIASLAVVGSVLR